MENQLNDTTFWLLLNALCKTDIIEYGTSPRYGWLSEKGKSLKVFFSQHSNDELYEMLMNEPDEK